MQKMLKQIGLSLMIIAGPMPTLYADQLEEMISMMNQAMMEPCNSKAYLSCLGLEQAFCRKQVGLSVDLCNRKYMPKDMGSDAQRFFAEFGACMQYEIITNLKISGETLKRCEPVLRTNLQNG